jgi:hypothetical protein
VNLHVSSHLLVLDRFFGRGTEMGAIFYPGFGSARDELDAIARPVKSVRRLRFPDPLFLR